MDEAELTEIEQSEAKFREVFPFMPADEFLDMLINLCHLVASRHIGRHFNKYDERDDRAYRMTIFVAKQELLKRLQAKGGAQ